MKMSELTAPKEMARRRSKAAAGMWLNACLFLICLILTLILAAPQLSHGQYYTDHYSSYYGYGPPGYGGPGYSPSPYPDGYYYHPYGYFPGDNSIVQGLDGANRRDYEPYRYSDQDWFEDPGATYQEWRHHGDE